MDPDPERMILIARCHALEAENTRLRVTLQQIMTMGHRLDCLSRSPLGSGCTCPTGVAELALTAPHQGAMSDG